MKALQISATLGVLVTSVTSAFAVDSGGPRGGSFSRLGGHEIAQKRDCRSVTAPKVLPAAGTIVDIAAVHGAVVADSASVPPDGSTFSLRFTENGASEWVEPIPGTGGSPPDPRLRALLARHVRLQPVAREPWSVRLKILPGDSTAYEVSRSEYCPVERIARRGAGIERVGGIATMDEINDLRNAGEARVVVDVSATGQTVRVALAQSSGSRIADDNALRSVRDAAFRPALLDGIPVAGRYEHKSRSTLRRTR